MMHFCLHTGVEKAWRILSVRWVSMTKLLSRDILCIIYVTIIDQGIVWFEFIFIFFFTFAKIIQLFFWVAHFIHIYYCMIYYRINIWCNNRPIVRVDLSDIWEGPTADENQMNQKHHEHCIPVAHRFGGHANRITHNLRSLTFLLRRKDRNKRQPTSIFTPTSFDSLFIINIVFIFISITFADNFSRLTKHRQSACIFLHCC